MASKRVLIVDDEENIGRSLRMILEREGYSVNVCKSVADFGKHPDAGRADAYLFDMKLPDGNGIDLLKAVRQNGAASPANCARKIAGPLTVPAMIAPPSAFTRASSQVKKGKRADGPPRLRADQNGESLK